MRRICCFQLTGSYAWVGLAKGDVRLGKGLRGTVKWGSLTRASDQHGVKIAQLRKVPLTFFSFLCNSFYNTYL
jgi:hypothetical protein